ncbi:MAG: hypothetical protein NUV77_12525 [Thermoguttaceae bacterium]|nr:hypothetical protein [Thermoguttaceae bacterium]
MYRASMVGVDDVLAKPEAKPGCLVAQATAGAVRALTNAEGKPLNLDVVAIGDENDPGHAEIRGPNPGKMAPSASRELAKLFKVVGR